MAANHRVTRCGTPSGYRKHHRTSTPACDACRDAWAADRAEYTARRASGQFTTRVQARIQDYAELRSWGETREQAAARVGVSLRTAERYEQRLKTAA